MDHRSKLSQTWHSPESHQLGRNPPTRRPCTSAPASPRQDPWNSIGGCSCPGANAPDDSGDRIPERSNTTGAEARASATRALIGTNTSSGDEDPASPRRTPKSPRRSLKKSLASPRRAPASPAQHRRPPLQILSSPPSSPSPRSLLRRMNYAEFDSSRELGGLPSLNLDDRPSVAEEFSTEFTTPELSSLSSASNATNVIWTAQDDCVAPSAKAGQQSSLPIDPFTVSGCNVEMGSSHDDEERNQRSGTQSMPTSPRIKSKDKLRPNNSDHHPHGSGTEGADGKTSHSLSKTWHSTRAAENKVDPTGLAERPSGECDCESEPSRKTSNKESDDFGRPQQLASLPRFDLDDSSDIEEFCSFVPPSGRSLSTREIDWTDPCPPPPSPGCSAEGARYSNKAKTSHRRSSGTRSLPASPSFNSRTRKSVDGRRSSRSRTSPPPSPRKSFNVGNRNTTGEVCHITAPPIISSPAIPNKILDDDGAHAPPLGNRDEHQTRRESSNPTRVSRNSCGMRGSTKKAACSKADYSRSPRHVSPKSKKKGGVSSMKSEKMRSPGKRRSDKERKRQGQVLGSASFETSADSKDDSSITSSNQDLGPDQSLRGSSLLGDKRSEGIRGEIEGQPPSPAAAAATTNQTTPTTTTEQQLQQRLDSCEIPWSAKMDLALRPLPQTKAEFDSFYTALAEDPVVTKGAVVASPTKSNKGGSNNPSKTNNEAQQGKRKSFSTSLDSPQRAVQLDEYFVAQHQQEAQPSALPYFDFDDDGSRSMLPSASRDDDAARKNNEHREKQRTRRGLERSRGSRSVTSPVSCRRGSSRKSREGGTHRRSLSPRRGSCRKATMTTTSSCGSAVLTQLVVSLSFH